MDNDRIVIVINISRINKSFDIEVPLNITINELIGGINDALGMGMDVNELSKCYLKCDNPIALLRGNKTVEECGLWNGSVTYLY